MCLSGPVMAGFGVCSLQESPQNQSLGAVCAFAEVREPGQGASSWGGDSGPERGSGRSLPQRDPRHSRQPWEVSLCASEEGSSLHLQIPP